MSDLKLWLEDLGLGAYAETFADNDIDLDVVSHLDDADLKELGLSLGHRRKLLAAAAKLTSAEGSAAPGHAKEPARAVSAEAERRQISILFCDLVGSTQLSQELDPESLHEVMRAYQDAVAGAVARYNGYVAKFLGDGVVAYFGWPQAFEDQAVRAVHAALASVEAVQALEATPGASHRLQVRAGIATGNVVVADIAGEIATDSGAVLGETPNRAARLQGVTEPNQIAMDDLTRRLIGSAFELESLGQHELKGFSKPIQAWRVVRVLRGGTRFEAVHGGRLTDFIGRDQELDLLRSRWRLAEAGEGQVVVFSGEPGIGKSRILREFETSVDGVRNGLIQMQCSPYGANTAFHPIVDYLYAAAGMDRAGSDEAKLDGLESYTGWNATTAPEKAALAAALTALPLARYPPLEMSPLKQKLRTIEALLSLVEERAQTHPLSLMVEDVHWIDPSSLEFFETLIERLRDARVLLVMTHRPEFEASWGGFGHVTQYSLTRLSKAQGRAIAERVTGGKPIPEEVLAQILSQTDGVPLFIEELTKAIIEADFLKLEGDRYVLAGPQAPVAIPSTLQGSLTARIDRLASVKDVIQAAACIGREFSPELLASILPLGEEVLEKALDQLVEAELVFRRRGSAATSYIFKHALVQDAAYDGLVKVKRQALHAKIAAALEGADEHDPMVLARHHSAAGNTEKAASYYFEAGRRSLSASALPEAIAALELGLRELETLESTSERQGMALQMRLMLGTARMAQFGWANPSVSDALEPAYPLAEELSEQSALGPLSWGLWVHHQTRTEFDAAVSWLDRLDTALEGMEGDAALELLAVRDSARGCQHFWHAEYDKAAAYTDHLRTIYDPQFHARIVAYANHDPLCFALHWAGSLNDWIVGSPEKSLRSLEEAIEIERRLGHPFNSAFALTAGAQSLPWLGQADRLLEHCDKVEKIAQEEGLGPFAELVLVAQWRGQGLIAKGEFAEGYRQLKAGNDFWLEMGGQVCNALFWSWQVRGLGGQGRIEEALKTVGRAIEHCRRTRDRWMEPECLRLKAELLLVQEDRSLEAEAEGVLREAIALAKRTGARSWQLRAASTLLELGRRRGEPAEAEAEVTACLSSFTEGRDTPDLRRAQDLLDA